MKQTTVRNIYRNRDKYCERALEKFDEWAGSPHNKELILRFTDYLATKSGAQRVAKLSSQLRVLADEFECDLNRITREDVERVIAKHNRHGKWSEATRADYRRAIRQFYGWYEDYDARLDSKSVTERKAAKTLYKWMRKELSQSYKDPQINFTEVISEEDIFDVAKWGGANVREQAFITVLWEGGLRIGEMLNLRIQDVQINPTEAILHVNGKTGKRPVPVYKSVGYLAQWLNVHPFREDRLSFLWLGTAPDRMHQPLMHPGAARLIQRCFARARTRNPSLKAATKWHNPHWFRHSRLSVLACKGMNEAQLRIFAGWGPGSKQPKTYVHLNSEQVRDTLRKMYGIKTEDEPTRIAPCSCGLLPDDPAAAYCKRCGKPLGITTALREKDELLRALEALPGILAIPARKARYEALIVQMAEEAGRGPP